MLGLLTLTIGIKLNYPFKQEERRCVWGKGLTAAEEIKVSCQATSRPERNQAESSTLTHTQRNRSVVGAFRILLMHILLFFFYLERINLKALGTTRVWISGRLMCLLRLRAVHLMKQLQTRTKSVSEISDFTINCNPFHICIICTSKHKCKTIKPSHLQVSAGGTFISLIAGGRFVTIVMQKRTLFVAFTPHTLFQEQEILILHQYRH